MNFEEAGDIVIIRFGAKVLDDQNAQLAGEQMFDLVDNQGKKKVLLNFQNVDCLSSAALGKLITLNKKMQLAGGKLAMCGLSADMLSVIEMCKLDKLFRIYADEPAALRSF